MTTKTTEIYFFYITFHVVVVGEHRNLGFGVQFDLIKFWKVSDSILEIGRYRDIITMED